MSNFERVYQIDPQRELIEEREKYPRIEIHHLHTSVQEKEAAPEIQVNLDVSIPEEKATKGKKNAESKSKNPKRKLKKFHSKSK